MYKIKELETNFIYDDIYISIDDAIQQISVYELDDVGSERVANVTYAVIDCESGEIIV